MDFKRLAATWDPGCLWAAEAAAEAEAAAIVGDMEEDWMTLKKGSWYGRAGGGDDRWWWWWWRRGIGIWIVGLGIINEGCKGSKRQRGNISFCSLNWGTGSRGLGLCSSVIINRFALGDSGDGGLLSIIIISYCLNYIIIYLCKSL